MQFESLLMEDIPSLSMSRQSSFESDFCRTPSDIDTGFTTLGRLTAGDDGFFKALEAGLVAKGALASLPELWEMEKLTLAVPAAPKPDVASPNVSIAVDNCIFACESVPYQSPASVGTPIEHNVVTLPTTNIQATSFDFNFQDSIKREFVDLLSTCPDDKFETKAVSPIIENDDCVAPPNSPAFISSLDIDWDKLSFADRLTARLEEKCEVVESLPKAEVHTCFDNLCLATRNCTGVPARYRDDAPIPTFAEYWKMFIVVGPDGRPTILRSSDPGETLILADLETHLDVEEADEQIDDYPRPLLEHERSLNRTVQFFTRIAYTRQSVHDFEDEEESFEYEEVKVVDNEDVCASALELFDCLEEFEEDVFVL